MRASWYFRRQTAHVTRSLGLVPGQKHLPGRAAASAAPPPPPTLPPPPPPPAPPTRPPPLPLAASRERCRATTAAAASVPTSKSKRPVFEEYWRDEAVMEGLKSGQLVKGRLHVPSFHTDRAFVIIEPRECSEGDDARSVWIPVTGFVGRNRALHGDEVVAVPLWEPWRPGTAAAPAQAPPPPIAPPPPPAAPTPVDPEEMQRNQFRDAVVAQLQQSEEGALPLSLLGQDETLQRLRRGLGSTLGKALRAHVDAVEVVQEGSPPEAVVRLLHSFGRGEGAPAASELPSPLPPPPRPVSEATVDAKSQRSESWDRARCRIVAVLERRAAAAEIVGVIRPYGQSSGSQMPASTPCSESGDDGAESPGSKQLKVQPRDRRLPAFWIVEEKVNEHGGADLETGADLGVEVEPASGKEKRAALRKEAQSKASAARAESVTLDALLRALEVGDAKSSGAGLLCVMQMVDWPCESLSPQARIIEVLGPQGSANAEADALLAFYGLEWRPFRSDIEDSLKESFPDGDSVVRKELVSSRADMRHLRCVTIDPPHARDLDDAVSIMPGPVEGSFRVGVHVADVTHFVAPGTPTDLEARRRATTVYLVGKVYPMLPRWLSEKLCSLLPDGDRLAFSVFFTLDADGSLVESDEPLIQRTVIRTCARLDYNEVDRALQTQVPEDGSVKRISADVLEDLRSLQRLTATRRAHRVRDGAVVLRRSSLAFNLDDDGRVKGLTEEEPSSASHHLIEELMVLANHVVALRLVAAADGGHRLGGQVAPGQSTEHGASGEEFLPQPLLRRHPDTEPKVRQRLLEILPEHVREKAPRELGLSSLLTWCEERLPPPTFQAVCADVMTAFKEAEYIVADDASAAESKSSGSEPAQQEESEPPASVAHWALSLPAYMHFTSPIRRYADVLVHRRLAHILTSETAAAAEVATGPGAQRLAERRAEEHAAFLESLKEAVKRCNVKKRDAQDAQLDSIQLALAEYVRASGGIDVKDAVITRILLPTPGAKEDSEAEQSSFRSRLRAKTYKEALEFYVPIAQCTRSVSLDVLNLELVSSTSAKSGAKQRGSPGDPQSVTSLRVRVRDSTHEVELTALTPIAVRLVSGQDAESAAGGHWTIRLPWAAPSASPRAAVRDMPATPDFRTDSSASTPARSPPLPPTAPPLEPQAVRPPPPPRIQAASSTSVAPGRLYQAAT